MPSRGFAVFDGVVAEVPDHLMQMAGIEAHLEVVGLLVNADLRHAEPAWFRRTRAQEVIEPVAEQQARRAWWPRGAKAAAHC